MSTGKRLAKRSILGTRVACCLEDGKYYAGVICAVKTMDDGGPTAYSVRVEGERRAREVRESDLVGSGFTAVGSVKLRVGQRAYITHNNREVCGTVLYHRPNIDEVLISVTNPEVRSENFGLCHFRELAVKHPWCQLDPPFCRNFLGASLIGINL